MAADPTDQGRVAIVAREAGAAAALAPVARELGHRGGVSIVAFDTASFAFDRAGLPLLAFHDTPSAEEIERFFQHERPTALLTGTSIFPDRDAAWWKAARRAGVPSIALVDHWCNYAERFSHRTPFDCLPDRIAVIDEAAAAGMREAGCRVPVEITGHPYFDDLSAIATDEHRREARRELGIDPDRTVVVFASQPQAEHYGTSLGHEPHGLFSEHDVAAALLAACERLRPDALLLVKLHPLERADSFVELSDRTRPPEVRVLRSYRSPKLIAAADVVAGMTSMFLFESALMGRPTVSLRPGGDGEELPWGDQVPIDSVLDESGVEDALRRALEVTPHVPFEHFRTGATQRLCELVAEAARYCAAPGDGGASEPEAIRSTSAS